MWISKRYITSSTTTRLGALISEGPFGPSVGPVEWMNHYPEHTQIDRITSRTGRAGRVGRVGRGRRHGVTTIKLLLVMVVVLVFQLLLPSPLSCLNAAPLSVHSSVSVSVVCWWVKPGWGVTEGISSVSAGIVLCTSAKRVVRPVGRTPGSRILRTWREANIQCCYKFFSQKCSTGGGVICVIWRAILVRS